MSDIDKVKVEEALAKLAPANANHWTADGKPKVETVKMFSGGQAVDRAYLDANYPDVCVTNPFGVKGDENTQVEPKAEVVPVVPETPAVAAATIDVPASVEETASVESGLVEDEDQKKVMVVGVGIAFGLPFIERLEEAAGLLETQEDIDHFIHGVHSVQARLVALLKTVERRSARTAGDSTKPVSQAELLAAMHASHAKSAPKRVEKVVEEPRFMVDKAKTKAPLR